MYTIKFTRNIHVPKTVAWDIISDLEQYADYAPNLSWAKVIKGEGEGLVRRCADSNGGKWNETCVLWDEGNVYSIQVDTSDYPYPFSFVQGTWGVRSIDDQTTTVTMEFSIVPQHNIPILSGLMFNLMMRPVFNRIGEKLMDNWETAMLHQHTQALAIA